MAFHIEDLPEATAELQQLIARHGYEDACIYGHALEGNYHFILNQSFGSDAEVKRYEELMNDVKTLVVDKYDGSLKAEHGTGRNMAPFVRYEWGDSAYEVMKAVKKLFDPQGLLNPGVIFNDDPKCHIKNFKPLPLIPLDAKSPAAKVNRCIECGFCEVNCLSPFPRDNASYCKERLPVSGRMAMLLNVWPCWKSNISTPETGLVPETDCAPCLALWESILVTLRTSSARKNYRKAV